MTPESRNNQADRELGQEWERNFCRIAFAHGRSLTPQQIGRGEAAVWYRPSGYESHQLLLPDISIWTAPGEHHEIKHKNPTVHNTYGLEAYRFEALVTFAQETQQPVLYTVHDWQLAGAKNSRESMPNRLADWRIANVLVLKASVDSGQALQARMGTWLRGQWKQVPGFYWPASLWIPLEGWWDEC